MNKLPETNSGNLLLVLSGIPVGKRIHCNKLWSALIDIIDSDISVGTGVLKELKIRKELDKSLDGLVEGGALSRSDNIRDYTYTLNSGAKEMIGLSSYGSNENYLKSLAQILVANLKNIYGVNL